VDQTLALASADVIVGKIPVTIAFTPEKVGCIPSPCNIPRRPATPSRKKG
jgi:hypothetical protein